MTEKERASLQMLAKAEKAHVSAVFRDLRQSGRGFWLRLGILFRAGFGSQDVRLFIPQVFTRATERRSSRMSERAARNPKEEALRRSKIGQFVRV